MLVGTDSSARQCHLPQVLWWLKLGYLIQPLSFAIKVESMEAFNQAVRAIAKPHLPPTPLLSRDETCSAGVNQPQRYLSVVVLDKSQDS